MSAVNNGKVARLGPPLRQNFGSFSSYVQRIHTIKVSNISFLTSDLSPGYQNAILRRSQTMVVKKIRHQFQIRVSHIPLDIPFTSQITKFISE